MGQLREIESKLIALGYQLVAISPDLPTRIRDSIAENKYDYTLLSDSHMKVAISVGVAHRLTDKEVLELKAHGMDIVAASGLMSHLLPVPSVFIVDTEGVILFEYVNPDYRVRIDSKTLLAAAEAAASSE